MMQQKEVASMIKDVKSYGVDAAMVYGATLNQVSLNLGSAPAPTCKSSKTRSMIAQSMKEAEQDPQVAVVIGDIKKNGPMAALKYAEDEALMKKLDSIFGDLPSTVIQATKKRTMEMIG